jgi:hypothetical protein
MSIPSDKLEICLDVLQQVSEEPSIIIEDAKRCKLIFSRINIHYPPLNLYSSSAVVSLILNILQILWID